MRSAGSTLQASASFITPRFIVLERGSRTARMRPCLPCCRHPPTSAPLPVRSPAEIPLLLAPPGAPLPRCKIGEDIVMIDLEVVQYCSAGGVMNELGAFVEEGGVFLASPYDKERRAGEPGRNREIQRHAADEEPGEAACQFQDPRQH